MYEQQSIEPDQAKRRNLVWEIDKKLTEDAARPIVWRYDLATCWYPRVHGITTQVNSIFNGWGLQEGGGGEKTRAQKTPPPPPPPTRRGVARFCGARQPPRP